MTSKIIHILFLIATALKIAAAGASSEVPPQQLLHPFTCEAPLLPANARSEWHIPGKYRVHLVPYHTLRQHFEAIQTDLLVLSPHVSYTHYGVHPERIIYGCTKVDDVLLAKIRSDPGVEVVWRQGDDFDMEVGDTVEFDGREVDENGLLIFDAFAAP
jgi:hypothetical protein